ncbi:hypothetical protein [Rhodanobacter soli]
MITATMTLSPRSGQRAAHTAQRVPQPSLGIGTGQHQRRFVGQHDLRLMHHRRRQRATQRVRLRFAEHQVGPCLGHARGQLAAAHRDPRGARQDGAARIQGTADQVELARAAILRQHHHAGDVRRHVRRGGRAFRHACRSGRRRTPLPWRHAQRTQDAGAMVGAGVLARQGAHAALRRVRRRCVARLQMVHTGPDNR